MKIPQQSAVISSSQSISFATSTPLIDQAPEPIAARAPAFATSNVPRIEFADEITEDVTPSRCIRLFSDAPILYHLASAGAYSGTVLCTFAISCVVAVFCLRNLF